MKYEYYWDWRCGSVVKKDINLFHFFGRFHHDIGGALTFPLIFLSVSAMPLVERDFFHQEDRRSFPLPLESLIRVSGHPLKDWMRLSLSLLAKTMTHILTCKEISLKTLYLKFHSLPLLFQLLLNNTPNCFSLLNVRHNCCYGPKK